MTRTLRGVARKLNEEEASDVRMLRDYAKAKKREKISKAVLDDLKGPILAWFEDNQQKSKTVGFSDDENATITVKERDNAYIDPEKLKKKIGARAFARLTTPQLDDAKVEQAIADGELDVNVVAACMENTDPTKYLECRFKKVRR